MKLSSILAAGIAASALALSATAQVTVVASASNTAVQHWGTLNDNSLLTFAQFDAVSDIANITTSAIAANPKRPLWVAPASGQTWLTVPNYLPDVTAANPGVSVPSANQWNYDHGAQLAFAVNLGLTAPQASALSGLPQSVKVDFSADDNANVYLADGNGNVTFVGTSDNGSFSSLSSATVTTPIGFAWNGAKLIVITHNRFFNANSSSTTSGQTLAQAQATDGFNNLFNPVGMLLSTEITVIPEPSVVALMSGVVAIGFVAVRRRRS